jgi:chromosome segregation ATPase
VQLEAKTKRIPQEQIDTWPQVSSHVLEQIEAVIRDAKKDIANTQRDERKVMAAHNTLNPLVRKLTRQLAASRIPPQAKDIHFNIDKLTERNAQLSREVTTARHSKQLLSEQANVAERMLEKDEEQLEQLKKDAKKWRTEWKHQEKHGWVGSSCLPK